MTSSPRTRNLYSQSLKKTLIANKELQDSLKEIEKLKEELIKSETENKALREELDSQKSIFESWRKSYEDQIVLIKNELTLLKEQQKKSFPELPVSQEIRPPKVESYAQVLKRSPPAYKQMTASEISNMKIVTRRKANLKTLHFQGLRRSRPIEIKNFVFSLGINPTCIRHVDFIGYKILELVIFEEHEEEIVSAFSKEGIAHLKEYDPESSSAVYNTKLDGLDEMEKTKIAKEAYKKRTQRAIERLQHPRFTNLREHLQKPSSTNEICQSK